MNSIKSVLANANELKRQGQLNQAIGQYYRAIQLNDKCSWSYYYLGETLTEYGNTDDAIHAYELAIELQPKQPWFHLFKDENFNKNWEQAAKRRENR